VGDARQLWRVYQRDWLAVYTSDVPGYEGSVEAVGFIQATYGGCIRDGEARISVPGITDGPERVTAEVLLPNLHGEWKAPDLAEDQQSRLGPDAVVVVAGSPEERELLDYGKRKLPA
jgi:hypothetical protein